MDTSCGLSYRSLDDVHRSHRTGFAVRHHPTPMFDDEVFYTWHNSRRAAYRVLLSLRPVADEDVIPIEETDLWRMERERRRVTLSETRPRRLRGSGALPSGRSSSSA